MNTRVSVIMTVLLSCSLSLAGGFSRPFFAESSNTDPGVRTYGHAVAGKVVAVDGIYTFRCNISGFPAVIGEDIAVRLDHIAVPAIVLEGGKPNRFFQLQAKEFVKRALASAETVRLENIKRGQSFSLIADVIVDSNSLADLLIERGLARRFAGEIRDIPEEAALAGGVTVIPGAILPVEQISPDAQAAYTGSKSSKVFHRATCRYAKIVSPANTVTFATKESAVSSGRRACKTCNP